MAIDSLRSYFVWPDFVNLAFYMKCLFENSYAENKTLVQASAGLLDAVAHYTGGEGDNPCKGYKYEGYSYAAADADAAVKFADALCGEIDNVEAVAEVRSACNKLSDYAHSLRGYIDGLKAA